MKEELFIPGSIWQTKNATLIQVLYISNLKLNQNKRPAQVVFRRKEDVISLPLKDFKKIVSSYVGQDSLVADSLYDILTTPIGTIDREEVPSIIYKLILEKEDSDKNCLISEDALNTSLTYYNEHNTFDGIYRTLGFVPSPNIKDLTSLLECFSEAKGNNTVYSTLIFSMNNYSIEINWDTITQVSPMVLDGRLLFTITFYESYKQDDEDLLNVEEPPKEVTVEKEPTVDTQEKEKVESSEEISPELQEMLQEPVEFKTEEDVPLEENAETLKAENIESAEVEPSTEAESETVDVELPTEDFSKELETEELEEIKKTVESSEEMKEHVEEAKKELTFPVTEEIIHKIENKVTENASQP